MARDTDKWLFYGGIAFLVYLLYKKLGTTLFTPAGAVPSSIGAAAQNFLSPGSAYTGQRASTYIVVFPDGSSHAVDPASVAIDGTFTYNGIPYTMVTGVTGVHAAYQNETPVPGSAASFFDAAVTAVDQGLGM